MTDEQAVRATSVRAIIVARPGPIRDGLKALLTAIPRLELLAEADSWEAGERLLAEHQPDLALLDLALWNHPAGAGPALRARLPATRCLLLADDVGQQAAFEPAAEAVLVKGASPAELVATIERLLAGPAPGPARG